MIAFYYWHNCSKDGFLKTKVESREEANEILERLAFRYKLVQLEEIYHTEEELTAAIEEMKLHGYVKKITKVHFKEYELHKEKEALKES